MDKESGSGIFPDPDLGDPKIPDPDPQHWCLAQSELLQSQRIQQGRPPSFTFIQVERFDL